MAKGRKPSVVVNGKLMTGQAYKEAIVKTLKMVNGCYLSASAIVNIASDNGLVERKNSPRAAHSHPIWRILTTMVEEDYPSILDWRYNKRGYLEYKLKENM